MVENNKSAKIIATKIGSGIPFRLKCMEFLFNLFCRFCGWSIVFIFLSIVVILFLDSLPILSHLGRYQFFTSTRWVPSPPEGEEQIFGSLSFIWGTLVTSLGSLLIAVPFGVASAAYLAELAPSSVRRAGAFLIELLAAIPSVVYGFWGVFFIAPLMRDLFGWLGETNTTGKGLLTAIIVLSIMILPYITAISFDACRGVPRSQREGALALGATRWQMIFKVVLPYARPGIIAACFLALGRALGETMAVTMLIGNAEGVSFAPWAKGDSIPSRIANQLKGADQEVLRSALITLGFLLLLVTATLNIVARRLLHHLGEGKKRSVSKLSHQFGNTHHSHPSKISKEKPPRNRFRKAQRTDRLMKSILFLLDIPQRTIRLVLQ